MSQFRTTPLVPPFLASGTAQPPHIDFEGIEVCHSERRHLFCGGTRVAYDHHYANFSPGEAYLASLPDRAYCAGCVEDDWVLEPQDGVPQLMTARRAIYAIPRGDGSFWYDAPLPKVICPVLGLSEGAEDTIRELLAGHSRRAIQRRTLASRRTIGIVADTLREADGDAMRAEGARPNLLHFDIQKVSGAGDREHAVLHVTASEVARGLHWTLAVIDLAVGWEWVVAIVAEIIGELPHPEALQALVTDCADRERRIVTEALEMVQAQHPDVRPLVVIDPFYIKMNFWRALARLRDNRSKPLRSGAAGRRTARRGEARLEERHDLEPATAGLWRLRPAQVAVHPGARPCLEKAFGAAPELKVAYELFEELRAVFDSCSASEADARYAAWQSALRASGLRCFDAPARWLDCEWPAVRAGFEAPETFRHSFPRALAACACAAACLAREIKALRRQWKTCSLQRLEQRVLARQGYIARTRRNDDI